MDNKEKGIENKGFCEHGNNKATCQKCSQTSEGVTGQNENTETEPSFEMRETINGFDIIVLAPNAGSRRGVYEVILPQVDELFKKDKPIKDAYGNDLNSGGLSIESSDKVVAERVAEVARNFAADSSSIEELYAKLNTYINSEMVETDE